MDLKEFLKNILQKVQLKTLTKNPKQIEDNLRIEFKKVLLLKVLLL